MAGIPTGTVTFLFTDIEGSTKLAREHPDTWETVRSRHHAILQGAIECHGGYVFQIIGDAFCAAFHTAGDALRAAVKSQVDLHKEEWGSTPIKVRMGIHTGKAEIRENGEYQGYLAMSRVQRLMSAGHGGQVLISAASQELLLEDLPADVSLRDLGERRLKDLIRPEHIYQLIIPGLPVDFPPLKTLDFYRHNLPVQLTSFIGREIEIREIKQAVLSHRLITLTGAGGTGKTRLALQVAAEVLDRFPDGVWFVDLAPITEHELITQTILSTLGVPDQPGLAPQQQLMDFLQEKKLFLLLDNCEHLLESCVKLVEIILSHAPELKILATSREALTISGEMIWHVPSLSLPDIQHLPAIEWFSQYEAVQLFIERSTLVQPHFQVTNANAPAIAQICFHLDGIPLAIELAAARVRTMSIDEIARRLDDRFRLLTGGSHAALERHQTLRTAIDWSYHLMSEQEKLLFARLAVFSGGWTVEAAEQVCSTSEDIASNDVFELLAHLVDKSLVILDESRYRMLETTRQYAREKLLDHDGGRVLCERHLNYFLDLAEQFSQHTHSRDKHQWETRISQDDDNFRAALEWCLFNQNTADALRLLSLWWPNISHRFSEMQDWFEKVNLMPGKEKIPAQYANLLNRVGGQNWLRGKNDYAKSVLQQSRAIWQTLGEDGEEGLAEACAVLGEIAMPSDPAAAEALLEKAYFLHQKHGNQWGMGSTSIMMAHRAMDEGKYAEADAHFQKSIAMWKGADDSVMLGITYSELGELARMQGDYERAGQYYEQCINDLRQQGKQKYTATALFNLAWVHLHQGDTLKAKICFEESLQLEKEDGNYHGVLACLAGLASSLISDGKPEGAARLFGAFQSLYEKSGLRALDPTDQKEVDRYMAMVREQLDEATFTKAWTDGGVMNLEQAVTFALEETRD
jgi:predicted ATPase/class 3 adenylate cyclase